MSSGYFKVHRSVFDHDAFAGPFSDREAFLWMIGEAAFKDHERVVSGRTISLKRGELCHSVRWFAQKFGWHRSKVERDIKRLKSRHMIGTRTETGITIISICNYDKFQGDQNDVETKPRQETVTPPPPKPRQNEKKDLLEEGLREEKKTFVASLQPFVTSYNAIAKDVGLPVCRWPLSKGRQRNLRARINDHSVAGWQDMLEKLARSPGLQGKNDNGWKANFGWIVNAENFTKILEGNYDAWGIAGDEDHERRSRIYAAVFGDVGPEDDAAGGSGAAPEPRGRSSPATVEPGGTGGDSGDDGPAIRDFWPPERSSLADLESAVGKVSHLRIVASGREGS